MKLIDFKYFEPFMELRKSMNITEEDEVDINDGVLFKIDKLFWDEVKKIGKVIPPEMLGRGDDGNTICIEGTDQRIVVYIKEQYFDPDRGESEYKFHISWCKTLEQMYNSKRYSRYVAVQKEKPEFLVDLINRKDRNDIKRNVIKKMSVCKNCLVKLNYKGYETASAAKRKEIYENFSLKEFLEMYNKTEILVVPKTNINNKESNIYTEDWSQISYNYRYTMNWKCENCGKDCKNDKKDLHVHHKDGDKRNNAFSNLMALCSSCHSKMPYHEHMKKNKSILSVKTEWK